MTSLPWLAFQLVFDLPNDFKQVVYLNIYLYLYVWWGGQSYSKLLLQTS